MTYSVENMESLIDYLTKNDISHSVVDMGVRFVIDVAGSGTIPFATIDNNKSNNWFSVIINQAWDSGYETGKVVTLDNPFDSIMEAVAEAFPKQYNDFIIDRMHEGSL